LAKGDEKLNHKKKGKKKKGPSPVPERSKGRKKKSRPGKKKPLRRGNRRESCSTTDEREDFQGKGESERWRTTMEAGGKTFNKAGVAWKKPTQTRLEIKKGQKGLNN